MICLNENHIVEQDMEWHNSVKVSCGGFSQISLDSNIDNIGVRKCKKITSLMAFMTKVQKMS